MKASQTLDIPIQGMDCADCTRHVQRAIAGLPGVESVEVFLASEKAVIRYRGEDLDRSAIRKAVADAGYSVPADISHSAPAPSPASAFTRQVFALLGLVFGVVLFVVVVGEGLGLFEALTRRIPWPIGLAIVVAIGFPVFRTVFRAALNGQVIAHTLMSVGALAALTIGQWATAAVVAFFMRVGDFVEHFTAERARRAVKDLNAMAPQKARLLTNGVELEIPIEQIQVGDTVIVRPGESIPVDGEVVAGRATVDQASLTGESMPVEAGPGSQVFAATLVSLGSLRVRATHIGVDSTFGRVIRLVEEAEANRADVQRLADRFSAYYLPVVAGIAALTFLIRRDPLATVAVLVVACSCSFALATPIAMLASIGAGARHGLLIKGGKILETLARADVLLIDKTGTLTLGKPQITDILDFRSSQDDDSQFSNDQSNTRHQQSSILTLAASAERYSEHPLAAAVRATAAERGLALLEPQDFEAMPGMGVRARLNGSMVLVGNQRMLENFRGAAEGLDQCSSVRQLTSQGKTLLFVAVDDQVVGLIAAADTLRPEIPQSLAACRSLGIQIIELLTGDNPRSAADLAEYLDIPFRAGLLPEDKIAIVRDYQSKGYTVVMVGDGVNDAPALAQADVGIAMGAAGSAVASEAAHIALLRDDWTLVPNVLNIARSTMRVVKMNIGFTAVYNLIGLTLAALGFLPPVLAAALQSLPDLGILANSSRLVRQGKQ